MSMALNHSSEVSAKKYFHLSAKLPFLQYLFPGLHKLFHPAISDVRKWSKLGEHGGNRENRKWKHQLDCKKHSICDSNTLFVTQTLYFTAVMATVITYALGEHDRGSGQSGRTSSKMWSPVYLHDTAM